MSKSRVLARLREMGLRPETISFYHTLDRDSGECVPSEDVEFGDCEICDEVGNLVDCTALGTDGKVYNFQALDTLVHGVLGKIAGAF